VRRFSGTWAPTRIAFDPQADGSALVTRAPDRIRLEPVLAPSSAVTLTVGTDGHGAVSLVRGVPHLP